MDRLPGFREIIGPQCKYRNAQYIGKKKEHNSARQEKDHLVPGSGVGDDKSAKQADQLKPVAAVLDFHSV